jgi:hypothetical protein
MENDHRQRLRPFRRPHRCGNRDVRLLRVIGVDSVRRKNARGENSDQYGYKLNHGYWSSNAQPATPTNNVN